MFSGSRKSRRVYNIIVPITVAAALVEVTNASAAGLTIITHGWGSGVDGWVASMADRIAEEAGSFSDVPQYTLVVNNGFGGGEIVVESFVHDGTSSALNDTSSGEAIIKIDWSDLDGGPPGRSTSEIGHIVADFLLTNSLTGHLWFETPIHFIGHSRGASVNTVIAERLGALGIIIDEFTTLDPHPVDGIRDIFDWDDAPITLWENIYYADNYWREDTNVDDFDGECVSGASPDLQLSEDILGGEDPEDPSYLYEHSDVHLWYHGTIGRDNNFLNTDKEDKSIGTNWYEGDWHNGGMGPRGKIGFYFSRIINGPRPQAGISSDFLGGIGFRTRVVREDTNQWPNIMLLRIGNTEVTSGDTARIHFFYQDRDSRPIVQVFLDDDHNPYNGNDIKIFESKVFQTNDQIFDWDFSWDTLGIAVRDNPYYLYGKISDEEHTRFDYCPQEIRILPGGPSALSNHGVTPSAGITTTQFSYRVDYSSMDGLGPRSAMAVIDGLARLMFLESGTSGNGTYLMTTTLSAGNHEYFFDFTDAHGDRLITPTLTGPPVGFPQSTSVVTFYFAGSGAVPISDNFEVCYRISTGNELCIPGSSLVAPGVSVVVNAPNTLHIRANAHTLNHQFRGWQIRQNGSIIPGGSTTNSAIDITLEAGNLGVASFWNYAPNPVHSIGGVVLLRNQGVPNAQIHISGPANDLIQTTAGSGTFVASDLPGGVPYTVTIEHVDYVFSPPFINIPNLVGDETALRFEATPADATPPEVVIIEGPSRYTDKTSVINFAWSGKDNKTIASNIEFQFRLIGSIDDSWSPWQKERQATYDLPNGVYTFAVKARDDVGNEGVEATQAFAVSAFPRIGEIHRVGREFQIRVDDQGLQADLGYILNLPNAQGGGAIQDYRIQWGILMHLGWEERVKVPLSSPNMKNLHDNSLLDNDLRLWRMGSNKDHAETTTPMDDNAYLYGQVGSAKGIVMHERLLDFVPADFKLIPRPGDPNNQIYVGTIAQFYSAGKNFTATPAEIWGFWNAEIYTYDGQKNIYNYQYKFQRFSKATLQPILGVVASPIASIDFFYPTRSPNGDVWLFGSSEGRLAYSHVDSSGTILLHNETLASPLQNVTNQHESFLSPVIDPGGRIWFFYQRRWLNPNNWERSALYLTILQPDGAISVPESVISNPPAALNVMSDQVVNYVGNLGIGAEGKIWVAIREELNKTFSYYYCILNPNGSLFKPLTSISDSRRFEFIDPDGFVWSRQGDIIQLLKSDDTPAEPSRPGKTLVPNQRVGSIAAIVETEAYRLFDRWSARQVEVNIDSDVSLEIIDIDKFDQLAHVENLSISSGGNSIAEIKGVLPKVSQIELPQLGRGEHILSFSQTGLLGGEILVSFVCPSEGDTHCVSMSVDPPNGSPGLFTVIAIGQDDSGDQILYTFTANSDRDVPKVVGPQAENRASFELTEGTWTITAFVDDRSECGDQANNSICTITVEVRQPTANWVRCDCNGDRARDISDAIFFLTWLFVGGSNPGCPAACNCNGDRTQDGSERLDISDAIFDLVFLFAGGAPPPPPYPECDSFLECDLNKCGI